MEVILNIIGGNTYDIKAFLKTDLFVKSFVNM